MKKQLFLLPLLAVLLTGCWVDPNANDSKVKINPLLLPGRWEAPSQIKGAAEGAKLIFVFQTEVCEVSGTTYGKWGYQLDQGDNEPEDWAAAEEDLMDPSSEGAYHRNGWFGWEVVKNGEIQLYNTTSVGGAVVPYQLRVKAFSSQEMTVIDANKTYVLKKVSE